MALSHLVLVTESQNHRIIYVGKGLPDHQVQSLTNLHFVNQTLALSAMSSHFLNTSLDGDTKNQEITLRKENICFLLH